MGFEDEVRSISTPDHVETSIGELTFVDGAPTHETVERVYDYLDTARGVEVFLNAMPGASVQALVRGPEAIGQQRSHQVVIFDELMSSESLFLTGNTSTLYALPVLDLRTDGPTVVEVPPGMLGAFNDMWFRYIGDVGPAGPDRGAGGSYLLLPPGYEGDIPDGYFVYRSRTFGVWTFMRGSVADGLGPLHIWWQTPESADPMTSARAIVGTRSCAPTWTGPTSAFGRSRSPWSRARIPGTSW